jgi:hypothetical protein
MQRMATVNVTSQSYFAVVKYSSASCGYRCYVHYGDLTLRELDYIVTISFGYILYCACFNLYSDGFKLFCHAWVCACVCGCPDNVYILNLFGYPD